MRGPSPGYLEDIYSSKFTVERARKLVNLASALDLTFMIDIDGKIFTKLHDKSEDFNSHIVNFLMFLSSKIPFRVFPGGGTGDPPSRLCPPPSKPCPPKNNSRKQKGKQ